MGLIKAGMGALTVRDGDADPFEMILSFPLVFEDLPLTRFSPLRISTSFGSASQ